MISGECSWSIIADIESVDYRRISKADRQDSKFNPDYYVQALTKDGRIDEENQDYIYVVAYRNDQSAKTICSNMVIYLLNEKGETIERLN
jgi:transposase